METNKGNKKKLIMAIALVLTIIAIGAGTTYAYYVINITGTSDTTTINVGAAILKATYVDGADLESAEHIIPGWSSDKYFTITEINTTNRTDIKYGIEVIPTTNTFSDATNTGPLKATLSWGTVSGTYGTSGEEVTLGTGTTTVYQKALTPNTTSAGTTIYFKLHISYPNNTSSVQAQTGSFAGRVNINGTIQSISQSNS